MAPAHKSRKSHIKSSTTGGILSITVMKKLMKFVTNSLIKLLSCTVTIVVIVNSVEIKLNFRYQTN